MNYNNDVCSARTVWNDTLKGIAIFLVVFGHCLMRLGGGYINIIIYSFHMPLFFCLTGYNIKVREGKFVRYNLKKIMYPYAKFCGLMFAFYMCQHILQNDFYIWIREVIRRDNVIHTLGMTCESMFSDFWFLPVLFSVKCFFLYFVRRLLNPKKMFYASILVALVYGYIIRRRTIVTFAGIGESFLAMPFLCYGFKMKKIREEIGKKGNLIRAIIIAVAVQLYIRYNNVGLMSMYNSKVESVVVFLLAGCSSSYLFFYFALKTKWCNSKNIFSYWGENSLFIYGIHYIILEILLFFHFKYLPEINIFFEEIIPLLYAGIIIMICGALIRIKDIWRHCAIVDR